MDVEKAAISVTYPYFDSSIGRGEIVAVWSKRQGFNGIRP
jgi:hypothetical protein